jgi:hypothetical protein
MSQSVGNNITIDDYSYNASLVSALVAGDYVRIESIAEPTQFMAGPIVQWGGTGTDMIVSIEYISSGNEYYEWLIKLGVKIGENSITDVELASDSVTTIKIQDGAVTEQKFSEALLTLLGEFADRLEALEIEIQKPHGVFEITNDPDSPSGISVSMKYFDNSIETDIYQFQNINVNSGETAFIPYILPVNFFLHQYQLLVDGDSYDLSSYSLNVPVPPNGIINASPEGNSVLFNLGFNYHHYLQIFLTIS